MPGSPQLRRCGAPGAVISYSFWQREYGGDPSVIARKLSLDRHPREIIGVTPTSFFGLVIGQPFDVAVLICAESILEGEDSRLDVGFDWWLTVMGRLKPAWSLAQATAQLNSISPGIFDATLPKRLHHC